MTSYFSERPDVHVILRKTGTHYIDFPSVMSHEISIYIIFMRLSYDFFQRPITSLLFLMRTSQGILLSNGISNMIFYLEGTMHIFQFNLWKQEISLPFKEIVETF